MKKLNFGTLILTMLFVGCTGSPSSVSTTTGTTSTVITEGMTLDQAIAEAALRIEERITVGSKIAPLNFNSSSDRFSSYVLDELTANLVENGKLIVVDRSEIDLIRGEFDFQYSGEVGDDSMQALGRMLGAQSIISGSLTDMGGFYRIMIRVLNVQNASVEVQYRTNIVSDHVVAALLTGGRTDSTAIASTTGQTMQATQPQAQQTVQVPSQQGTQTTAQSTVVIVEGATLAEKLLWLETNAVNNTEYRLEVNSNENLSAPTLSYPRRRNVTVRLISSGEERILSLSGNGSIFTVDADVTLILDNGITLQGRNQNNASLVKINERGTLIMNSGVKIIGNTTSGQDGSGVYVSRNGNFTMIGGEITRNTANRDGSGVFGGGVFVAGTFTMRGGEIYNNNVTSWRSANGAGVYVSGTFTMTGGEISGNTASGGGGTADYGSRGGGVHVAENGIFTMSNGEIYGNKVSGQYGITGGGVFVARRGTFSMTGGEISGNTTSGSGGGVYADGIFTKTGGIIYGSTGDSNGNIAGNGHAVGGERIRNSTAGSTIRLDSSRAGAAGGWEN